MAEEKKSEAAYLLETEIGGSCEFVDIKRCNPYNGGVLSYLTTRK